MMVTMTMAMTSDQLTKIDVVRFICQTYRNVLSIALQDNIRILELVENRVLLGFMSCVMFVAGCLVYSGVEFMQELVWIQVLEVLLKVKANLDY